MKLNAYCQHKLQERLRLYPQLRTTLYKQAQKMSHLGIKSDNDQQLFFNIWKNLKPTLRYLTTQSIDLSTLSNISEELFHHYQGQTLHKRADFIQAVVEVLIKKQIPMTKTAYPVGSGDYLVESPYNLTKWLQTMQEIYDKARQGWDSNMAFNYVTQNWDDMEQRDFKRWMSFYEENAHQKYKIAQERYIQPAPGVMIPMDHLKAKLPNPDMSEYSRIDPEVQKKEEIKKKIKALVGRLNSAERLATDPEVRQILQIDLDLGKWLEELQRVKRLVQLAPMRHHASSILEDIIVKEANLLTQAGFPKAAAEMIKLAQETPTSGTETPSIPETSAPPSVEVTEEEEGDQAMEELIKGMNFDQGDLNDLQDPIDDPLAKMTIIAQAVPPQPVSPSIPETSNLNPSKLEEPVSTELSAMDPENLEVQEEEPAKTPMHAKTDNLFEAALDNITIHDVINRLETLANLFRTREIPRQLAIIDLMMDKLNISAFFPSLAEASSKSLESNQYSLTRIEEILSKLRGAVKTPKSKEIDLTGEDNGQPEVLPTNITTEQIQENLQNQIQNEKQRKEKRQQEQLESEQTTPITNVTEDLSQPLAAPPPPAVPTK